MDTAAFILALLTFLAVGFWYVENEMKASDGAHGLFAVRQAEKPRKARTARYADDAQRYRPRGAAAPAVANDDLAPAEAPKYRRKERAWDRAAKLDDAD
jgi:hypothetical protein